MDNNNYFIPGGSPASQDNMQCIFSDQDFTFNESFMLEQSQTLDQPGMLDRSSIPDQSAMLNQSNVFGQSQILDQSSMPGQSPIFDQTYISGNLNQNWYPGHYHQHHSLSLPQYSGMQNQNSFPGLRYQDTGTNMSFVPPSTAISAGSGMNSGLANAELPVNSLQRNHVQGSQVQKKTQRVLKSKGVRKGVLADKSSEAVDQDQVQRQSCFRNDITSNNNGDSNDDNTDSNVVVSKTTNENNNSIPTPAASPSTEDDFLLNGKARVHIFQGKEYRSYQCTDMRWRMLTGEKLETAMQRSKITSDTNVPLNAPLLQQSDETKASDSGEESIATFLQMPDTPEVSDRGETSIDSVEVIEEQNVGYQFESGLLGDMHSIFSPHGSCDQNVQKFDNLKGSGNAPEQQVEPDEDTVEQRVLHLLDHIAPGMNAAIDIDEAHGPHEAIGGETLTEEEGERFSQQLEQYQLETSQQGEIEEEGLEKVNGGLEQDFVSLFGDEDSEEERTKKVNRESKEDFISLLGDDDVEEEQEIFDMELENDMLSAFQEDEVEEEEQEMFDMELENDVLGAFLEDE